MSIKKIIIIFAVTILSFGASFGVSWFTNSKKAITPENITEPATASIDTPVNAPEQKLELQETVMAKSLPERRLQNLIEDARNKIRDCKLRQDQLDQYSGQLEMTKQTLMEDVSKLTELHEQLSKQISELKKQQQILDAQMVEIKENETERLQQLASVYDNMDEAASASIFVNMISNNQLDDAAKIVFFMSDRKSAKVLAEITNQEPTIARVLCSKIKNIKEQE